ncbi:MAG: hypothetical protein PHH37_15420 [Paludibacter sp.]|nr:hypothetical protein [Paludibacter sp.]
MKHYKFLLFLLSAGLLLTGCSQIEDDPSIGVIDVSKASNIKRGEPVVFKFKNVPDSSNVAWNITPADGVDLRAVGSSASVLFSFSGNYTINATYQNTVLKSNVTVSDSVYAPVTSSLVPLMQNETMSVTAIINDSSAVGKPEIALVTLVFRTSNKYDCLNNFLLVNKDPVSGLISFEGVYTPDSRFCSAGQQEAEGAITLNPDPELKNNKLEISLVGTVYKGYYYVSDKKLYVDWPYTEKIVFTDAIVVNNQ